MRIMKLMVVLATAFLTVQPSLAANVTMSVADSLESTQNSRMGFGHANKTKGLVGGVLGSILGQAASTDTTANSSNENNAGALASQQGKNPLGGALGGALGSLFGNIASSKLTAEKIAGTWSYIGSKCVLESDNVLKKAGSEMMVAPLEKKINKGLEKIGMKPGSYSFVFKEDGSFTSNVSGRPLNGRYTLNPEEKKITMNYLGGLVKMTMDIVVVNGKMGLLYDSDKILVLANALAGLSNSATMKTLKAVLESYDGMKIGLEFKR